MLQNCCAACPQFPREYDFTRLHDSYYDDLFQCSTCSLQQLYLLCNTIPECMGFNTLGWLKARINTLHLTGSRCQGIYIKINPCERGGGQCGQLSLSTAQPALLAARASSGS